MNSEMNKRVLVFSKAAMFLALISLALARVAEAEEFMVSQENKQFSAKALQVKIGDTVHFGNADPFYHNVFSLSRAATFDLGSYPKGQTESVVFEEPGVVEVECSIHPRMKMKITVVE